MYCYVKKYCLILAWILIFSIISVDALAQCAMCSLNAENSTIDGNLQGAGLNNGILFLLAMPFIIAGIVGIVWYKYYRKVESNSNPIFGDK